ncbi:glycosyltransferase family 4 protein [Lactobacillus delbrueckii subsp. bulgaricus]|nr:hypothetical protein [Lactobacillus delbrueckii subsp. bulgaricus]
MNYNKVIFVCDYAANYAGNFIASLDNLAKQLDKMQKKVIFIFPNGAKNKNWEISLSEFKVVYSDFNNDEVLLKSIKNEILSKDSVIIHTHFINSLFLVKLKTILSNNDKIVFHQHMAVNYGVKQIVKGIILRLFGFSNTIYIGAIPGFHMVKGIILRLFGFSNTIYIGVSPAVYNDVCREVGKNKARLVTNSLDLMRLQSSNTRMANKANKNVLIFGSQYKRKGVDLAIKAIQKGHLESKVRLIVVTHTPDNTKELIKDKFGSIPRFIEVIKPSKNVEELYKNSFLFLSPSRSEAFGYSVIEAAYSGLKVIASDIPGQNTLEDVPNIRWVDSENVQQLGSAILDAYQSPKENAEDIAKTKKVIEKNYSLDRWVKQIIKIYNE